MFVQVNGDSFIKCIVSFHPFATLPSYKGIVQNFSFITLISKGTTHFLLQYQPKKELENSHFTYNKCDLMNQSKI